MYIETYANNFWDNNFVCFERTDIIQVSYTTFLKKNYFSTRNKKSMGWFSIQLMLRNGQWHSKYISDKSTKCSTTSEECTSSDLAFTAAVCSKKNSCTIR